jgi:hypothetical protein
MRKRARGLLAVTAGALLLAPAPPAAAAGDPLPTREEIQAVYPDQVNRFSFPPSDFSVRSAVASWTRLSVTTFATPRDERAGRAVHIDPATLPVEHLQVYQRTGPAGAVEYQVLQEVVAGPTNYFPVFRGTPGAFSFADSVTEPGPGQLTCRTLREFLACRVIRLAPRRVSYQTFQAADPSAGPAPTDRELHALFADQRSHWSFVPPAVTPWTLAEHWRRIAQIQFDVGADELVVEPEVINPIPKELRLFTRTVRHRTEVGIIEWADRTSQGGGELLNLFPDFSGDLRRWVFYDTNAIPGFTYQETCRRLHKGATDFLLCRTILQGAAVFYQTYIRA